MSVGERGLGLQGPMGSEMMSVRRRDFGMCGMRRFGGGCWRGGSVWGVGVLGLIFHLV